MLAMSTTRRAMFGLAIALGLGLVLTTQGTAQEGRPGGPGGGGGNGGGQFGPGGFGGAGGGGFGGAKKFGGGFEKKGGGPEKKFDNEKGFNRNSFDSRDGSPGTSFETVRLQQQVKALNTKLMNLTAQLRDLKPNAAKASTARGPEKKGPPDWNKGPFGMGGLGSFARGGMMGSGAMGGPGSRDGARFDKKGSPSRAGFDRKGPPSFGRDMRGDPRGREYARDGRRGPSTSARDSRDRRGPSMDRGRERGPQARGPQRGRPEPSRSSLESRLDRLIGELEAIRREVRNRR